VTSRLLAISWEMPPLSGPRAIQVSRLLAALTGQGWTSRVIAVQPRPGGPLLRDTPGAPVFDAEGVDVSRVPSPQEGIAYRTAMKVVPGLAHRPDRQSGWIPAAVREAERWMRAEHYDCLVSFAQPWTSHMVGLRLAREHGMRWVAHFSDPWVDSPYQAAAPGAMAFARRAEADVIRHAAAIVFVTHETRDVVMAKYPEAWRNRVHVVPHGYDARVRSSIRRQRPRGSRLRLVYTGRFYPGLRTPGTLFRALERLADERPLANQLEVVLIGSGMDAHRALVHAHRLERVVQLENAVPYEAALQAAADADVLLVLDAEARGASMFLPSKLVEYMLWRVPILGLTPPAGATAALLRRMELPIAPPDDVEAIASAVARLLDAWQANTLHVAPAFDAVAAEYDIGRTSALFAGVLQASRPAPQAHSIGAESA
jgi:glycosyltransferase involved in cell wall biosynthesis